MKRRISAPVGILGIGVEGRAVINYLLRHGIDDITALDQNEVLSLPDGVATSFGPHYADDLERFRTIFRSPGIRPDHPAITAAREAGSLVTSAISYFLEMCPAPVIGVTGTVGKGTAASLTTRMLEEAGLPVCLGGNIGRCPLDFLDDLGPQHRVVLEISSFQAMDVSRSPHIAVVLKTTSEHLDWHLDLNEYLAAKTHLLAHQTADDIVIFNEDSEGSKKVAASSALIRHGYSLTRPAENGIFVDGESFILSRHGKRDRLPLSVSRVRLAGRFNLENVAAALLAAIAAGASPKSACLAAEHFDGLPHRLELVTQSDGVRYYNDSYATRPEATLGAIGCFTDAPLALILGGSEKFADFKELSRAIQSHPSIVYVALIGSTAQRLRTALDDAGSLRFEMAAHEDLASAVQAASNAVRARGVVLLSPACASFGLFPNYKVRGEAFRREATALACGAEPTVEKGSK